MEDSHKQEAFGYEQEKQSILNNPRNLPRNSSSMSNTTAVDKTVSQQLIEKLDKIVVVLLVLLFVMYLLQSSGTQPKKNSLVKSDLELDIVTKDDNSTPEDKKEGTKVNEGQDSSTVKSKTRSSLEDLLKQLDGKDDNEIKAKSTMKEVKDSSQPSQATEQAQTDDEESQQTKTAKYIPHRRRTNQFQQRHRTQHLQLLKYAKYNLNDPQTPKQQRAKAFQQEYNTLQSKYQINDYPQHLSICIVIHSSSHKKAYAHQYVLNSIFNQNYTDYTVVFIADGYDADEVEPIKQFLKKKDRKKRVKLVWNDEKKYFLASTVTAIRAFCMQKKVTALMDGDDELLGANVFQLINTFYRRHNANFVYGNFIEYHAVQQQMKIGFSTEFQDSQKRENTYRSVGQKFGSIKTFKTRLISFIKDSDLKDKGGEYYRYAGDYALIYPLLQLSCGEVRYMPQYNYLFFGYEIDPTFGGLQIANGRAIREKQRYECFKEYK